MHGENIHLERETDERLSPVHMLFMSLGYDFPWKKEEYIPCECAFGAVHLSLIIAEHHARNRFNF